ncbi:hypothetical protein GQ53DRAFT_233930 [Thozetella sp. PMI_491]|nr:hypothetical protein GQ53DRAFT_233930 [Thozetella sp. PMI_491]
MRACDQLGLANSSLGRLGNIDFQEAEKGYPLGKDEPHHQTSQQRPPQPAPQPSPLASPRITPDYGSSPPARSLLEKSVTNDSSRHQP